MGAGPPVLLVHGLNGFKEGWGRLPDALAGAGHRAVAVDLPGFGETPRLRGHPRPRRSPARWRPWWPSWRRSASSPTRWAPRSRCCSRPPARPGRRRRPAGAVGAPAPGRFPPRGLTDVLQLPLVGRALARAAIAASAASPSAAARPSSARSPTPTGWPTDPELEVLLQAAADRLLSADLRAMVDWAASGVVVDVRPLVPRVAAARPGGLRGRRPPDAARRRRVARGRPARRTAAARARRRPLPAPRGPEVVVPVIVEHLA